MANKDDSATGPDTLFENLAPLSAMLEMQGKAMREMFASASVIQKPRWPALTIRSSI